MKYLILILLTIIYFAASTQVEAATAPKFTSCVNPQGEIVAQYSSGSHGIAGKTDSFEGSDAVYKLSGDALTQCFCSSNGTGIQTDWWKVSSLTSEEVDLLRAQGWIYVPNGALWGLDNDPYLALNSEYICKGGSTGGSGGGNGGSGGSTSGSSSSSGGVGSVLGASTGGVGSVLGLASTGNSKFLYSVLFISVFSLLGGTYLKLRTKKLSK